MIVATGAADSQAKKNRSCSGGHVEQIVGALLKPRSVLRLFLLMRSAALAAGSASIVTTACVQRQQQPLRAHERRRIALQGGVAERVEPRFVEPMCRRLQGSVVHQELRREVPEVR